MEYRSIVILFTFALFGVAPLIGLILLAYETYSSRKYGRYLDTFASGLKDKTELLRQRSDLSRFDAEMSYWLEQQIVLLRIGWLRTTCRLLMDAKVIVLGEEHRWELAHNETFRFSTLRIHNNIILSISEGDSFDTFINLGRLLALMYCHGNSEEQRKIDSKQLVIDTLRNCSNMIPDGLFRIDSIINRSLKLISENSSPEAAIIPLLLLRWLVVVKGIQWENVTDLKTILTHLADLYEEEQLTSMFAIIYNSFKGYD